jgi:tetratricopeptide (TPR) repeat protein
VPQPDDRSGDRSRDRGARPDRGSGARGSRGSGSGRPRAGATGGGKGTGNGSQARGGQSRPVRAGATGVERRPSSPRRVEPALPDDVTGRELDRAVRAELTSLASQNAEAVSRHLVMAGRLLDDDPETAYAHAVAARDRAGRVAAVREAAGIAAYVTGRYAEALAELRAARRMSGDQSALPVMADCERGLGRPEKALAIAASPEVAKLDAAGKAEMLIVASGARRDLGQPDAAALLLQGPELHPGRRKAWSARLFYAYADALLAAGREDEAVVWFGHAAEADETGETDADERLDELAGVVVIEHDDADDDELDGATEAADRGPSDDG